MNFGQRKGVMVDLFLKNNLLIFLGPNFFFFERETEHKRVLESSHKHRRGGNGRGRDKGRSRLPTSTEPNGAPTPDAEMVT